MGTNNKTHVIIFLLFILIFSSLSSIFATANDDVNVNIHMIDEKTRILYGKPTIIAGIWHFINVTIDVQDFQELNLKFYQGYSIPDEENRDETNYYEWKYDKNSDTPWIDIEKWEGREYINIRNCTKSSDTYSFCIGIKDTLPSVPYYNENWTLEVYKDANKQYSENIVVEKPTPALAKSHGDIINFNVDPFTIMDVSGDDYFRIENTGNLPLIISIDYGSYYNNLLEVTGLNTIISPDSSSTHYFNLHSESWKPEVKDDIPDGTISGLVPTSYIITTAQFFFATSPGINAPGLRIYVRHANYKVDAIPDSDITFQYRESLEMSEGEIKDIPAYISGNGVVTLDLRSINLTIKKVFSENTEVSTPVIITSTNTSEHTVTTRVEALRENSIAYLYYDLEIGGPVRTYFTEITVGPPVPTSEGTTLDITLIMAVLLIIFLVVGYMMYSHRKYRRR